jgi:hypothetical protein
MSSHVVIEPTKFENVRTGETALGYLWWDDDDQGYMTTENYIGTDTELLEEVFRNGSVALQTSIDAHATAARSLRCGLTWFTKEEYVKIQEKIADEERGEQTND